MFKVGDKVKTSGGVGKIVNPTKLEEIAYKLENDYVIVEFEDGYRAPWPLTELKLITSKQFTKDDLKEKYEVVLRNGHKAIYFDGCIINSVVSIEIDRYFDDLKYVGNKEGKHASDIMQVIDLQGNVLFARPKKRGKLTARFHFTSYQEIIDSLKNVLDGCEKEEIAITIENLEVTQCNTK